MTTIIRELEERKNTKINGIPATKFDSMLHELFGLDENDFFIEEFHFPYRVVFTNRCNLEFRVLFLFYGTPDNTVNCMLCFNDQKDSDVELFHSFKEYQKYSDSFHYQWREGELEDTSESLDIKKPDEYHREMDLKRFHDGELRSCFSIEKLQRKYCGSFTFYHIYKATPKNNALYSMLTLYFKEVSNIDIHYDDFLFLIKNKKMESELRSCISTIVNDFEFHNPNLKSELLHLIDFDSKGRLTTESKELIKLNYSI